MPNVKGVKYPYTKAGMNGCCCEGEEAQQEEEEGQGMSRGLYANIHAKRKRIKAGSKEKMRKPGSKGAPTAAAFRASAKTAKKKKPKTRRA